MVYDTGNPTEPLKRDWFELKVHDKKWNADLVGRTGGDRCYAAEHVLEWQLLKQFIQDDMDQGAQSRCAFLYTYFIDNKMPRKTHKVQVAKQNAVNVPPELDKNGHFDYEEASYDFSKWNTVYGVKDPRAIDWICT
jgi:hypothetical protein